MIKFDRFGSVKLTLPLFGRLVLVVSASLVLLDHVFGVTTLVLAYGIVDYVAAWISEHNSGCLATEVLVCVFHGTFQMFKEL